MNYRNQIITGDCLTVLQSLPDNIVQTVVTSPPYYGLRSYLPDDHPDKALEIGLEETPDVYITRLVQVFREVRRVLREDGTLWLNIGDSYSGSGKGSGGKQEYLYDAIPRNDGRVPPGLKPKDLMMIPARVAIALQADGWWLRSEIIWHKLNPTPESMTDRPTRSHEHVFLLAKSESYYYNQDAIREPHSTKSNVRNRAKEGGWANGALLTPIGEGLREWNHPLGRNKRSVWTTTSQPYPEAHFATFPPKLIEPCILAGSKPGDIVLDPFMGAGTTAFVAIQHGRDYLGIDLNPEYVKLIDERIDTVQQNLWSVAEGEVVA